MTTILLIEDNEMNRDMLSRRLTYRGFEIVTAEDGPQGLAAARAGSPDLILMDMSLPGVDGWELARRLKKDGATREIPIIALTAHAMPTDEGAARAAGCDDFDTKPVDLERLLAKMQALLRARVPAGEYGSDIPPEAPEGATVCALLAEEEQ